MPTVADVSVKFGADTSDVDKGIAHVEKSIGGLGSRLGNLFGTAGGFVLGSAINKVVGSFGSLLGAGIDFEQGMANVNSVMELTGQQAKELEALILHLGSNTAASSNEVAGAAESLAKAGVSWSDMMSGALQGAVNLSLAAGDISSGQAAEIIANTMNMFNLSGDQATAVSDAFAAGANKSTASAYSLAQGLAQGGAAVVMFGGDMYDAIGILSLFDQNSLKGADAGTALKTMLLSLLNPTNDQAQAMSDLGLSFFDANGQFIGFSAMAEELKTKLSGLTEEQRNTALATIFGSDAVRAANILYEEGAAGVDEYTDAVKEQGAATKVAEKRLDSLRGSIEQFKGALETLAISGTRLAIPFLRGIVDFGTRGVNALTGQVDRFSKWAGDFVGDVKTLKKSLQNPLGQNFGFNLGEDTKKMGNMRATTQALGIQIKRLTGIDMTNWLNRMGKSILRPIDASKKLFRALTDRNWSRALEGLGDLLSSGPKAVGDFFKGIETGIKPVDKLLHTFGKSWTDVGRLIQEAGQGDWDGFQVVLDRLGRHLLQLGEQLGGFAIDALKFTVSAAISVVPKLAEILWGGAKDLYGWVEDKILGTVGGSGGAAITAGGGGGPVGGRQIEGKPIDVGKALLKFGVGLAGDIWEGAKDLYGWISKQILGGGRGGAAITAGGAGGPVGDRAPVDVGTVFISAAVDAAKDGAGAIWGWLSNHEEDIKGWLRQAWTGIVNIGDFFIEVGVPQLIGWLTGGASVLHNWLQGQLFGGAGPNGSADPAMAQYGNDGGSGFTFEIQKIALDILDATASIDENAITTEIQNQIDYYQNWQAELHKWVLVLHAPDVQFGGNGGGGQGGAGGGGSETLVDSVIRQIKENYPSLFFGPAGQVLTNLTPLFGVNPMFKMGDAALAGSELLRATYLALLGNPEGFFTLAGFIFQLQDLGFKAADSIGMSASDAVWAVLNDPTTPISVKLEQVILEIWDVPEVKSHILDSDLVKAVVNALPPWIRVPLKVVIDVFGGNDPAPSNDGGSGKPPVDIKQELADDQAVTDYLRRGDLGTGQEAIPTADANVWGSADMYNPPPQPPPGSGGKKDGQFLFAPNKQLVIGNYRDLSKGAITALDPFRTDVPKVFSDLGQRIGRTTDTTSRDTIKSFTGMGSDVIAQMTSMQGGSLAAAGLMSSGVVGGAGLMQTGTTGAAGAMNTGVVGQANSMSSGAILAAMQMATGVYTVVSAIPIMLGTIDLRGAGYSIGVSLGEGLVAGLNSQIAAVQTAAAGLAAAASTRTQKELGVASPSRVFTKIGEQVGEGFVDGIESSYAAAAAAGRGLGASAVQPMPNPAWNGSAGRGGDTYVTQYFVSADSERLAEIARNAKRGADLAKDLPGLLVNSRNA